MLQFSEGIAFLKQKELINEKTTFAAVFNFIRSKIPQFNYQAVRVYGINSISEYKSDLKFKHRLLFEVSKPQYIDIKPAIQICIFKSNGLNLRNYRIVHPDEYVQDYVV